MIVARSFDFATFGKGAGPEVLGTRLRCRWQILHRRRHWAGCRGAPQRHQPSSAIEFEKASSNRLGRERSCVVITSVSGAVIVERLFVCWRWLILRRRRH